MFVLFCGLHQVPFSFILDLFFFENIYTFSIYIISGARRIVQTEGGGFSVKEYTVMFHSVSEIADFTVAANRLPFPVHFLYGSADADAKSILSMCCLPLREPITVRIPARADETLLMAQIRPFLCAGEG